MPEAGRITTVPLLHCQVQGIYKGLASMLTLPEQSMWHVMHNDHEQDYTHRQA